MLAQEIAMMLTLPEGKQELYKTDVEFKTINLNENYKVPNKYRKRDVSFNDQNNDGVHKDIVNYRNRRQYSLTNPKKHTLSPLKLISTIIIID